MPGGVTEQRLADVIKQTDEIKGDFDEAIKELKQSDILREDINKNNEKIYIMSNNMTQAAQAVNDPV